MDPTKARRRVEAVWNRSWPGHPLLVDAALVALVERHGEAMQRPVRDDAVALPDPIDP
jgi:hypothetical protein